MKTISYFVFATIPLILSSCVSNISPSRSNSIEMDSSLINSSSIENGSAQVNSTIINSSSAPLEDKEILIAYFSATNRTKYVAEVIQEQTGGTLHEIVPTEEYTIADLQYSNPNSRTSIENNDDTIRPEISDVVDSFLNYGVIFLGYPIWFGKAPKVVYTFVESYDFSNKLIIPFCTSSLSGMGSSVRHLESLTNGGQWEEGRRFATSASENTIISWIEELNI